MAAAPWRRRIERNGVVLITAEISVLAPIWTATTFAELLIGVLAVLAPTAGSVYVTEQAFRRGEVDRIARGHTERRALSAIATKARAILIAGELSNEINSGAAAGGMPSGPIVTYTAGSLVASIRAGETPHGHMLWSRLGAGLSGRAEEFGASTGPFASDVPDQGRAAIRELLELANAAAAAAEALDQAWTTVALTRWQHDSAAQGRAQTALADTERHFADALLRLDDRVAALEQLAADR